MFSHIFPANPFFFSPRFLRICSLLTRLSSLLPLISNRSSFFSSPPYPPLSFLVDHGLLSILHTPSPVRATLVDHVGLPSLCYPLPLLSRLPALPPPPLLCSLSPPVFNYPRLLLCWQRSRTCLLPSPLLLFPLHPIWLAYKYSPRSLPCNQLCVYPIAPSAAISSFRNQVSGGGGGFPSCIFIVFLHSNGFCSQFCSGYTVSLTEQTLNGILNVYVMFYHRLWFWSLISQVHLDTSVQHNHQQWSATLRRTRTRDSGGLARDFLHDKVER